jgi:hypothetical protein
MRQWAVPVAAIALPLCLIAELLPIRSYSTADGLANDGINKIVADSRGFVWFCTSEGLSRFDGYRFANFGVAEGLPHRSVTAFLETRPARSLPIPGGARRKIHDIPAREQKLRERSRRSDARFARCQEPLVSDV